MTLFSHPTCLHLHTIFTGLSKSPQFLYSGTDKGTLSDPLVTLSGTTATSVCYRRPDYLHELRHDEDTSRVPESPRMSGGTTPHNPTPVRDRLPVVLSVLRHRRPWRLWSSDCTVVHSVLEDGHTRGRSGRLEVICGLHGSQGTLRLGTRRTTAFLCLSKKHLSVVEPLLVPHWKKKRRVCIRLDLPPTFQELF